MPGYLDDDAWKGFCSYWDNDSVKAKSTKARQCRMSEPDGPGTGIVKHKGGSKSMEFLVQELAAAKGVPVTSVLYDSFRALHVKKDGTYTDKKFARIDEAVKDIAVEMGEFLPDTPVDLSKINLDVMEGGLDKKRRLFGVGSLANTLKNDVPKGSTTSMSSFETEQVVTRLGDVEKELQVERDRTSRLEEQFQNALKVIEHMKMQFSSASRHPDSPPPAA